MKPIQYTYARDILMEGFKPEDKICRIDGKALYTPDGRTHITFGTLLLSGSDVFMGGYIITSEDGGRVFGEPRAFNPLPETIENGIRSVYSLSPYYHRATNSVYCIGRVTRYRNDKEPILYGEDIMPPLTGRFDTEKLCFTDCERLQIPEFENFSCVTFMQPLDEPDGSVLIPAYVRYKNDDFKNKVVVVRFDVNDGKLIYREQGAILSRDEHKRGLDEPRIARLNGKYYMTIRTDEIGLLAYSDDGLNYSEPTVWHWDDGEELTSRNTQQAWVQHPEGLFLVYTRETPHNTHIFRRRAPLFMARFDEERNCLVKESEVIVVPEMGARLGNFTVTQIKDNEAWICVSEWMQSIPEVCYSYGARNRLWRTRIMW